MRTVTVVTQMHERTTNELEMENQNIGDRSASIIKPNRLG